MWGAEIGVNEHGVAVSNEAVFTSRLSPYVRRNEDVLLGMDVVRLALERSTTAREALKVMTLLHERYDQGGSASFARRFYYHNSYMIVDCHTAFILETSGRHWVARQVRERYAAISNVAMIEDDWDWCSADLYQQSQQKQAKVRFASMANDRLLSYFGAGAQRRKQVCAHLDDSIVAMPPQQRSELEQTQGEQEQEKRLNGTPPRQKLRSTLLAPIAKKLTSVRKSAKLVASSSGGDLSTNNNNNNGNGNTNDHLSSLAPNLRPDSPTQDSRTGIDTLLQRSLDAVRDHRNSNPHDDRHWTPASAGWGLRTSCDVCLHAGFGPVRATQTTASMVIDFDRQNGSFVIWVTGTASPCTSLFKPLWFDTLLAEKVDLRLLTGPMADARFDSNSLWWRHERLNRLVLLNYAQRRPLFERQRCELERSFLERSRDSHRLSLHERAAITNDCFAEADRALDSWIAEQLAPAVPVPTRLPAFYGFILQRRNEAAGFDDDEEDQQLQIRQWFFVRWFVWTVLMVLKVLGKVLDFDVD
jgi:hypothetical protein